MKPEESDSVGGQDQDNISYSLCIPFFSNFLSLTQFKFEYLLLNALVAHLLEYAQKQFINTINHLIVMKTNSINHYLQQKYHINWE